MQPSDQHQLVQSDLNGQDRYPNKNRSLLLLPMILSVALLSACGGGDGGTANTNTTGNNGGTTGGTTGGIIRINAGGGDYVDSMGQTWSADYGFNLGDTGVRTNAISGTVEDTLYQSERYHSNWQDTSAPELEYQLSLPSGDYAVKLHFAEVDQYVSRSFDVEVEGQMVIDNLDIVGEVGRYTALTKNIATTVSDGEMNIRFPRNSSSPKISAIEIIPAKSQTVASTKDISHASIQTPDSNQEPGSLSIIGEPANGSASITGSEIVYTPNAGFSGQDTIIYSYTSNDGSVHTSTVTVSVTVDTSNITVIANPDSSNTQQDNAVNVAVLANDSGLASSPVVSIEGTPANGNVSVLANNTITYTPDTSYVGTDSFSYRVDNGSSVAVATVTVDVQCSSCAQDKTIGLSWNPSVTGSDIGYLVYYGASSNNVNTLLIDLSENTGLNPDAPYVEFSTQNDLNLSAGDNVCFRISAYKSSLESALSPPVCGII